MEDWRPRFQLKGEIYGRVDCDLDLKKEPSSADYKGVLDLIKSEGNWACLSESSYAMDTQMSPQTIYEKCKPYLDSNDHILIITLKRPYFGYHSKEVIDWLDSKLT